MQKFYKIPKGVSIMADIIGANSAAFKPADPVSIDADGCLIVATAGDKVLGYACDDITMVAANETTPKVRPNYIPAVPGVLMQYPSDQAGVLADDVGEYADLSGTTGAITMNLTAGATGQFLIRQIDPENEGDTDVVIVEAAEPQTFGFAQS